MAHEARRLHKSAITGSINGHSHLERKKRKKKKRVQSLWHPIDLIIRPTRPGRWWWWAVQSHRWCTARGLSTTECKYEFGQLSLHIKSPCLKGCSWSRIIWPKLVKFIFIFHQIQLHALNWLYSSMIKIMRFMITRLIGTPCMGFRDIAI